MKKNVMKRAFACFAVLAMVSLTSSVASAASACSSLALPVNVATSILMTSTGCDAGTLNFSNFAVTSTPGGMTVSLSNVTVVSGEADLSFQITSFSSAPSTGANLRLVYEVKGSTNVNNLFAGSSGTTIMDTVCDSSGVIGGACKGTQIGQLSNGGPISFATQTDIWVIQNISLPAGAPAGTRLLVSGFATGLVTQATQTTSSAVPEPMTLSMIGAGLLGLSLISRRRKKS